MMSADFVRDRIVAAVKEKTGRDLVVAGSASFNIFPSVGVSLEKVSLSGVPEVSDAPLRFDGALDVNVSLLPLLQRELRVKRLVLSRAAIQPRRRCQRAQVVADAPGRRTSVVRASSSSPRPAVRPSDAPGGLASRLGRQQGPP